MGEVIKLVSIVICVYIMIIMFECVFNLELVICEINLCYLL